MQWQLSTLLLLIFLLFPPFLNGFMRPIQIFPLDDADTRIGQVGGYANPKEVEDGDYYDDDEDEDEYSDEDEGGGGGRGNAIIGMGGIGLERGPNARFWQNAIGPFLYTFEDGPNRRKVQQLWLPVLGELNRLRHASLGKSFNKLQWDAGMAHNLAQKEYTSMAPFIVPMSQPVAGIMPNLKIGMQLLFQAVIHRYIRCERSSRNCKGKRDKQFRYPIELVDSKARRIGCVARMFKNRVDRHLRFGAICTTDRSVKRAREKLILFKLDQLRNDQLRHKLIREAVTKFVDDDGDDESSEEDDDEGKEEEEYEENANGRGFRVKVQEGDILQAKVDAIVSPTNSTMTATAMGPQNSEEAIAQVTMAKSMLDVVKVEDGTMPMSQKRMQKELKRLAEMVDPNSSTVKDKQKAKLAQNKVFGWQQAVANDAKWAQVLAEARQRMAAANGGKIGGGEGKAVEEISERIIRAGGNVLADKLRQLAQERGGQPIAIGDAVATESFKIRENYFATKIIHTVPPNGLQSQRDKDKLAECYKRTLKLAADLGIVKIAFPEMMPRGTDESIRQQAAKIGMESIKKWMDKNGEDGQKTEKKLSIKTIIFRMDKEPAMLRFYQDQIQKIFGSQ